MSVSLTSNFLQNARGITFEDGGGITWSINSNTNAISANGSGAGSTGANPTAKVGLAAVNGSATTFMRSDGAPPLDVSIAPVWTGNHTWSGNLTIKIQQTAASSGANFTLAGGPTGGTINRLRYTSNAAANNSFAIRDDTAGADRLSIDASGNVKIVTSFGINGSSPPTQPTGYGTPTGAALTASFAAGSITLAQLAAEVAQLILDLKKYGIIGA